MHNVVWKLLISFWYSLNFHEAHFDAIFSSFPILIPTSLCRLSQVIKSLISLPILVTTVVVLILRSRFFLRFSLASSWTFFHMIYIPTSSIPILYCLSKQATLTHFVQESGRSGNCVHQDQEKDEGDVLRRQIENKLRFDRTDYLPKRGASCCPKISKDIQLRW